MALLCIADDFVHELAVRHGDEGSAYTYTVVVVEHNGQPAARSGVCDLQARSIRSWHWLTTLVC